MENATFRAVSPKDGELMDAPDWFTTLIQDVMTTKSESLQTAFADNPVIAEGERNATLTRIAGRLRGQGASEPDIVKALMQVNLERCKPPLTREEVEQIATSVARYEPESESATKTFAFTDLGNAERLVARYGDTIRYCGAWKKWLIWDGKRWVKDEKQMIRLMAYQTVRSMYREAATVDDTALREKLAKHALGSESEHRINAMISMARALPGIPVTPKELDTNQWFLNVANGTVDLRTGALIPHNPKNLLSKLANIPYDPHAECPVWLSFLNRIMDGNEGLVRFLQKAIGYALTGDVREQVIFFCYGNTGKNGKSTFLNTIKSLLGDYSQGMQPETLMAKQGHRVNNDIARLQGVRFVAAIEGEEGQRLSESLVKQMTGGDIITARFLHQEFFEFEPTHKIFFGTNHKPVIRGTDDAIWRRIRLIPFGVTIPESERDNELPEKLRHELPGILRWALEGCRLWQQEGLGVPPEVENAVNEYRSEMDVFAKFILDCCVQHPQAKVASSSLYEAYTSWCDDNGERPLSQRMFGMKLAERGFQQSRTSIARMWVGVGLRSNMTQVTHNDAKNNNRSNVTPLRRDFETSASPSVIVSSPPPTTPTGENDEWEEGIL